MDFNIAMLKSIIAMLKTYIAMANLSNSLENLATALFSYYIWLRKNGSSRNRVQSPIILSEKLKEEAEENQKKKVGATLWVDGLGV